MSLANWFKFSVVDSNYNCGMFPQKKQFRKTGTPKICIGSKLGLLQFCNCRRQILGVMCFEKALVRNSVEEVLGSVTSKTDSGDGVRTKELEGGTLICQLSFSAVLINCLNALSINVVVWDPLSTYISMMKRRTLKTCSLKQSIKNYVISVLGNLILSKLCKGEGILPSYCRPHWLPACKVL